MMAPPAAPLGSAALAPPPLAVLAWEDLTIATDSGALRVPATRVQPGAGAILSPTQATASEHAGDLGAVLARVMATLAPTQAGQLLVCGMDPWKISYLELCRLRRRLGFVPGRGGLLSNRTLLGNLALPLSVHAGIDHSREQLLAQDALDRLGIGHLAQRFPHAIDGPARFAACVARALVLEPELLVIEGVGDFEAESDGSHAWRTIASAVALQTCGVVICLGRTQPAFERWWRQSGIETVPVSGALATSSQATLSEGA